MSLVPGPRGPAYVKFPDGRARFLLCNHIWPTKLLSCG